jgi:hypothetical protein
VALGRRQFRLLLWGVKQRLAGLPPERRPRARLRAVVVSQAMRWQPAGTFIQTGMDAMNAMLKVPGEFASFGHDYAAPPAPAHRADRDLAGGVPLRSRRAPGTPWLRRPADRERGRR